MPSRTAYEPSTFCWTDLSTLDVEGARRFYGGLLGWEFQEVPGGLMATLKGAPVAAIFALEPQSPHPSHWNSYVAVAGVDDTTAQAVELGATVVEQPFDVGPAGRLSLLLDPTSAAFCLWQAGEHIGAGVVNEPGSLTWNHLATGDVAAATSFYAALFGWTWENGIARRADGRLACSASPPIAPEIPPHWSVFFAVSDLEAAERRVPDLGGRVLLPPQDAGPGRFIAVADPAGATVCLYAGEMDD